MGTVIRTNADPKIKYILSIKSFVPAAISNSAAPFNLSVIASLGFHMHFSVERSGVLSPVCRFPSRTVASGTVFLETPRYEM